MPLPFTRKRTLFVERILAATRQALKDLMGDSSALRNLKAVDFTDEQFGVPTVTDIIKELEKPGRDPRSWLKPRPLLRA